MATSPLDILCKVAAAESRAPPLSPTPGHPPPQLPLPPPPAPPHPPPTLPPLHPPPDLRPRHPYPLPPPPFSALRLSSSAPSHAGILSHSHVPSMLSMPVEMPIAPVGRMYEQEMRPSSYEPPTYLSSLSMPPPAPYPRTLLNPVPGAQTAGGVMPRNLSAPSLMVPSPEDAYMTGVNGIPVSRAPPSANIPVPSSRPTFPSRLGSLSPHYNSPSTSTRRTSSPTTRSVSSRRSSKSSGRRDSYTRFTAEEEAMLMEGVRVFGVGNWKKILNSYRFHWKRTAVDLKDKYRNMTRAKMRRMQVGSASDLSSVGSDDGRMAVSPLSGRVLGGSPLSGGLTASALSTMSSGVTNGVASGMNGVGNGMNGMNGMNGLSAMGSPSSAISNGASSITNGLNGVGSPSSGVTNGVNGMSGFTYSPAEGEMRR